MYVHVWIPATWLLFPWCWMCKWCPCWIKPSVLTAHMIGDEIKSPFPVFQFGRKWWKCTKVRVCTCRQGDRWRIRCYIGDQMESYQAVNMAPGLKSDIPELLCVTLKHQNKYSIKKPRESMKNFWRVYLPVIVVPRQRKAQRKRFPARVPKWSMICPWLMVKIIPKI